MAYIVANSFWIVMQDGPIAGRRLLVEIRVPVETYQLLDQTQVQYATGSGVGVIPAFGDYADLRVYQEPENEFYTVGIPQIDGDVRAWRVI